MITEEIQAKPDDIWHKSDPDQRAPYREAFALGQASMQPVIGAPDAKEAAKPPCDWTVDDDGCWHTGCSLAFEFNTDGPIENKVRFCHGCGKPVKVQETKTTNEKGTE